MQKQITRGRFKFRKIWVFPSEVIDWFRHQLKNCEHPVLHVPCGSSLLGDVLVDQYFEAPLRNGNVIKADMFKLPFDDATFPTILSDPPWELQYDKRAQLVKELVRILEPNGTLLFNSFWVPDHAEMKIKEMWIKWPRGGFPSNPSLLIRSKKLV
jgi:hypothetical protein